MSEEVLHIKFAISAEAAKAFDWGDIEVVQAIQSGDTSELTPRDMRLFVARFMVDGKGEIIPHARAVRILRKVPQDKIAGVMDGFRESINELAVPNASGRQSNLRSEAVSVEASPDGAPTLPPPSTGT